MGDAGDPPEGLTARPLLPVEVKHLRTAPQTASGEREGS
jgi:hypothetical protein